MSRHSIASGAVLAAGLGLLVTVLTTDSSVLSLEIWVGSTLAWFGLVVVAQLAGARPTAAAELRPIWRRQSATTSPTYRPVALASTDRVVGGSLRQARLFESRLQPRLAALVDESGKDACDLGGAAWIIEAPPAGGADRVPTMDELVAVLNLAEDMP